MVMNALKNALKNFVLTVWGDCSEFDFVAPDKF